MNPFMTALAALRRAVGMDRLMIQVLVAGL
jgi:hypothetical protein